MKIYSGKDELNVFLTVKSLSDITDTGHLMVYDISLGDLNQNENYKNLIRYFHGVIQSEGSRMWRWVGHERKGKFVVIVFSNIVDFTFNELTQDIDLYLNEAKVKILRKELIEL